MTTIVENLKKAIEVVEAWPGDHFDLTLYTQRGTCGTLYCTAGLLACQPFFREQLCLSKHADITEIADILTEQREMFGVSDGGCWPCWNLFASRRVGEWDADILAADPDMSDKDLALARLRRQLAIYEVMP